MRKDSAGSKWKSKQRRKIGEQQPEDKAGIFLNHKLIKEELLAEVEAEDELSSRADNYLNKE